MPTVLAALKRAWSYRPVVITAARLDRLAAYDWYAYLDGTEDATIAFRAQYGALASSAPPVPSRANLRLIHSA